MARVSTCAANSMNFACTVQKPLAAARNSGRVPKGVPSVGPVY
jgi:hypothetical protein